MLEAMLRNRPWLLADGAMATSLFDSGLAIGTAPETWIDRHPDRIGALHRRFVAAGADIILTNTFGCNARRLALHGLASDARRLSRKAAEIAIYSSAGAARPIVVAGSIGPTGDAGMPADPATARAWESIFFDQVLGLKEGGAHVAWIETMSNFCEIEAAARAAHRAGLPVIITVPCDNAGRTMDGQSITSSMAAIAALTPAPLAFGINCGSSIAGVVASIATISAWASNSVIAAKSNAGMPKLEDGKLHYPATTETMADYAQRALTAGARIIGGCCGATPDHIAAMRLALDMTRPQPPPADIV